MFTWLKKLRQLLLIFGACAGIIFLAIYFAFTTPTGSFYTLNLLRSLMPGQLQYEFVSGRLSDAFDLQNIHYTSPTGVIITARQLHVAWQPSALLHGQLHIDQLLVNHPLIDLRKQINTASSKKTASTFNFHDLQHLVLQDLQIEAANIYVNTARHLFFEHINLRTVNDVYQLEMVSKHIATLPAEKLYGRIAINHQYPFKWHADLTMEHLNLGAYLSTWQSNLHLHFVTTGEWFSNSEQTVNLHVDQLSGQFGSLPVRGQMQWAMLNGHLHIDTAQVYLGTAYLNLIGELKDAWHLNWELNVPDLHNLAPDLHGNLRSTGKVTGSPTMPMINAALTGRHLAWQNDKINAIDGRIQSIFNDANTTSMELTLKQLTFQHNSIANLNLRAKANHTADDALVGDVQLVINTNNQLHGNYQIQDVSNIKSATIAADLMLKMEKLNTLITSETVTKLEGQLLAQLKLSGPLRKPLYDVKATFKNGGFYIPKIGLQVSQVDLTLQNKSQSKLGFEGELHAGAGTATVLGSLALPPDVFALKLQLHGKELAIVNLSEYKINASPTLELRYADQQLSVQGALDIPSATITPQNLSNVLTLPDETVIVDDANAPPVSLPTALNLDVRVNLGKSINVAYENLKAQLNGALTINQDAGRPMTALGEFKVVHGSYTAYGNTLRIRNGRIVYAGGKISNPEIDIEALKTIKTPDAGGAGQFTSAANNLSSNYTNADQVLVGVAVKGNVEQPQVSLISTPSLSQEDILSYLVFGYPRSQVTGASSISLLNSLSANMSGSKSLQGAAKKFQNSLGLSQLDFGSTNYYSKDDTNGAVQNTATTVNIGKKLGRKLSIHYSLGVFDSVSIFSIRYQISHRFALQSQASSLDMGADLLYEYER